MPSGAAHCQFGSDMGWIFLSQKEASIQGWSAAVCCYKLLPGCECWGCSVLCQSSAGAQCWPWLGPLLTHISIDNFASDGPFQSTLTGLAAFSFWDSHPGKEIDASCTNPMVRAETLQSYSWKPVSPHNTLYAPLFIRVWLEMQMCFLPHLGVPWLGKSHPVGCIPKAVQSGV